MAESNDPKDAPCASRRAFLRGSAALLATPAVLPVVQGCGGSAATPAAAPVTAASVVAGQPLHVEGAGVFLVRSPDGIGAISETCTHQACAVNPSASGEGFDCACHGSRFDAMGRVENPPATTDLPWHPVTVEGGNVTVDTSSTVPAGTYTPVS